MKTKQFFTKADSARAAQAYLIRKCRNGDNEYLERGAKTDQSFASAIAVFSFDDELTLDIELRKFSQLCIKNLTDAQWLKLRTAVRVKRKKEKTNLISIDITEDAHLALKRMAQLVGTAKSLSQVILLVEQQLSDLKKRGN